MTDSYGERNGERTIDTGTEAETETDAETGTGAETNTDSPSNPTPSPRPSPNPTPEHDTDANRRRPNARVLTGSPAAPASNVHTSSSDDALESDLGATLERIVVQYEDEPNRWTLVPQERTADERLTAWLSADEDVFVDRSAMR
ncbi:DUF7511 domain-containing protein [Natrialba sp. SSL1]|uniref:DUF7511 domain-containing protein n=1 Tax=Natrialba sp. SSL1 TaxID=1869245 RepID=UPI0008F8D4BD|nr:hypothetical protein [Natrialba sp. SSL1]OIB58626.1 hypothetical protein BBD46_07280 [Natrialba sp. SSL1]